MYLRSRNQNKQLTYQPLQPISPLKPSLLLFDIDGVIRDVAGSYRRALQETVHHYCGWRPTPNDIDVLKSEGLWNNDWDASLELLRRQGASVPARSSLVTVFSGFYFGDDPDGDPASWKGFIGDEPLLVGTSFFDQLQALGHRWGFVSGAEPASARYVLSGRLGLVDPPLVAMGDAPDKPDPTGLIQLAEQLMADFQPSTVAYLGDTVADVHTVNNARRSRPDLTWLSLAVAPPHVQRDPARRGSYEQALRNAGAQHILRCTPALLDLCGDG